MGDDTDLVRHLATSLAVSQREASRVVQEVVAFYDEPLPAVVRRRHAECRLRGMRNEAIYDLIVDELAARVVAAPPLTARQVRRIIYG